MLVRTYPQLFIDLDGVLADFDRLAERILGYRPDRSVPERPEFWPTLRAYGTFFADMPLMQGAQAFWEDMKKLHPNPIILSGIPSEIESAEEQKRSWVWDNIGPANMIFCKSRHKRKYAKPGDILVDDWDKYRDRWEEWGGTFVLHTSNADSWDRVSRIMERA